jgi:hypothetical protein
MHRDREYGINYGIGSAYERAGSPKAYYASSKPARSKPKTIRSKKDLERKDAPKDGKEEDKLNVEAKKAKKRIEDILDEVDKILEPSTVAETYHQTSAE